MIKISEDVLKKASTRRRKLIVIEKNGLKVQPKKSKVRPDDICTSVVIV